MVRERLNAKQAAEYMQISYGKFAEMVRNHEIPHLRIGNRIFAFKDSLDQWLENLEQSVQHVEK
jgi:excisionase family DNA binding protein